MRGRCLLPLMGLLASGPAYGGFFTEDAYEPPSPRFGTTWVHGGMMIGGWRNDSLLSTPIEGLALDGIVRGELMLLPLTKVGLRVGASSFGGASEVGDREVSLRQYAGWTDATVEIQTRFLRAYVGKTLLGYGATSAPSGTSGASYSHVAGGVGLRYARSAEQSDMGEMEFGIGGTLEVRRTRMVVSDAASVVPRDVAGWTVVGAYTMDFLGNKPLEDW
jgi:hypothetical protein